MAMLLLMFFGQLKSKGLEVRLIKITKMLDVGEPIFATHKEN